MEMLLAILLLAITSSVAFAQNQPTDFYISVNPGEHHLCASWPSSAGFTDGHKSAALQFTAAAGNIYFFLVRDHIVAQAGMEFLPLDSDEAQLLMSKFAFSTSRSKT